MSFVKKNESLIIKCAAILTGLVSVGVERVEYLFAS